MNGIRSDSKSHNIVAGKAFVAGTYVALHWLWLTAQLIMYSLSSVFWETQNSQSFMLLVLVIMCHLASWRSISKSLSYDCVIKLVGWTSRLNGRSSGSLVKRFFPTQCKRSIDHADFACKRFFSTEEPLFGNGPINFKHIRDTIPDVFI
jgi:hypothetical protein